MLMNFFEYHEMMDLWGRSIFFFKKNVFSTFLNPHEKNDYFSLSIYYERKRLGTNLVYLVLFNELNHN